MNPSISLLSHEGEYLTTHQAAAYAAHSPNTLKAYRVQGRGPSFVKVGKKVLYRRSDLDQWLFQHLVDPARLK